MALNGLVKSKFYLMCKTDWLSPVTYKKKLNGLIKSDLVLKDVEWLHFLVGGLLSLCPHCK